jgi:GNAT superfamily N-acetyltransferase
LEQGWGSTHVARLGESIDAATLPGFVATIAGDRVGLLTYADRADGVEVVTIQALLQGRGVGRALMDEVQLYAVSSGAQRLWLVTTNDNTRAADFYERWGMKLVRLIPDGVVISRGVKPTIPLVGIGGTMKRHEFEFERRIAARLEVISDPLEP